MQVDVIRQKDIFSKKWLQLFNAKLTASEYHTLLCCVNSYSILSCNKVVIPVHICSTNGMHMDDNWLPSINTWSVWFHVLWLGDNHRKISTKSSMKYYEGWTCRLFNQNFNIVAEVCSKFLIHSCIPQNNIQGCSFRMTTVEVVTGLYYTTPFLSSYFLECGIVSSVIFKDIQIQLDRCIISLKRFYWFFWWEVLRNKFLFAFLLSKSFETLPKWEDSC